MKHAVNTIINCHLSNFDISFISFDDPLISSIDNYDIESCFNDEKDNGEEGFDCGGPCRRKCVGMINFNFFTILRF